MNRSNREDENHLGEESSLLMDIESRIQARVGLFLQLKQNLIKMQTSAYPDVKSLAIQLMASQTMLEEELKRNLVVIDSLKASEDWSIGDLATIGAFAYAMEQQINSVQKLQQKEDVYTGKRPDMPFGLDGLLPWIAGAALVGIVFWVSGRKK